MFLKFTPKMVCPPGKAKPHLMDKTIAQKWVMVDELYLHKIVSL